MCIVDSVPVGERKGYESRYGRKVGGNFVARDGCLFRNYHVFYQLLAGCTEEQQEMLRLRGDDGKYPRIDRVG